MTIHVGGRHEEGVLRHAVDVDGAATRGQEAMLICVSAGTNRSRQGAQESREYSNRHVSKKANNKTPTCPAVADCCRQGRQSRALFANNHQIGDETLVTWVPVPGGIGS